LPLLKQPETMGGGRSLKCLNTWRQAGGFPLGLGVPGLLMNQRANSRRGKSLETLTKGNKVLNSFFKMLGRKSCIPAGLDVLKESVISLKTLRPPRACFFLLPLKTMQSSATYGYLRASVLLGHLTARTL